MGINKFNAEGYHDPTPHKALSNITREEKAAAKAAFKPLVYICSPFSGDIENNNKRTRAFCRFALDKGNIPLAPHLMFPQFMDDSLGEDRQTAMFMNLVLLSKCAQLWVFGSVRSEGMQQEIKWAKRRHMTIRHFTEELEEIE